jgi:predicted CopG family antitoxin
MPTIRVDEDVFEGLQKLARPFVDSPSSVIRRLLEEKGVIATEARARLRDASIDAPQRGSLTPQSVYEQFLLHVLEKDFKGKGHKRDVTNAVIRRMMAEGFIRAPEQEMVATGETRAENTITWGRNALKDRGYISRQSARGTWELTPEGRSAARAIALPKARAA